MKLYELFEASQWTIDKVKDEILQDISYGSSGERHPYFRRLDVTKAAITALKYLNQNKTLSHALGVAYREQGMHSIDSQEREKSGEKPKKGTGKGRKCGTCNGTGKVGVNDCGTCGGLGIVPGGGSKRKDDKEKAGGGEKQKKAGWDDETHGHLRGDSDEHPWLTRIKKAVGDHVAGGKKISDQGGKQFDFKLDKSATKPSSRLNKK